MLQCDKQFTKKEETCLLEKGGQEKHVNIVWDTGEQIHSESKHWLHCEDLSFLNVQHWDIMNPVIVCVVSAFKVYILNLCTTEFFKNW